MVLVGATDLLDRVTVQMETLEHHRYHLGSSKAFEQLSAREEISETTGSRSRLARSRGQIQIVAAEGIATRGKERLPLLHWFRKSSRHF